MFVKFNDAELAHLNRLRTLRAEREREFLQLDNITRGFVEYLAQIHGMAGGVWSLNGDCTGLDVTEPLQTGKSPHADA
jgi:hypothetical protein